MEREVVKYSNCFICGPQNPIGLKLKFLWDGERCRTTYRADCSHEGYKGILHGGIVSAILDEVMIKAVLAQGILCLTAKMEVKFKAPAPVVGQLSFQGRVQEHKGRIFKTVGSVQDDAGVVYAEAVGTYVAVGPEIAKQLETSLET
jgi:acyl-coenzyme A thioesterase PaaI-like protein